MINNDTLLKTINKYLIFVVKKASFYQWHRVAYNQFPWSESAHRVPALSSCRHLQCLLPGGRRNFNLIALGINPTMPRRCPKVPLGGLKGFCSDRRSYEDVNYVVNVPQKLLILDDSAVGICDLDRILLMTENLKL